MAGWGTINWNDILENVGFFWIYNFDYSGLLLSWNIASEWNEGIKLFPPLCYNLVPIYPTPKEEAFQLRDIGYLFINWQFIVTFSFSFKQTAILLAGEAEKAFGLGLTNLLQRFYTF